MLSNGGTPVTAGTGTESAAESTGTELRGVGQVRKAEHAAEIFDVTNVDESRRERGGADGIVNANDKYRLRLAGAFRRDPVVLR